MSVMSPTVPNTEEAPRLPMPSRNPLPLSAAQEAQVRDLYYSRVRGYCALEIKGESFGILSWEVDGLFHAAFATCALGRTFSAPFICRQQRLNMNSCMISRATQDEQDAAREEWFALRFRRQKDREAKEEKRKEQEKFHKEWWGLPVEDGEQKEGRETINRIGTDLGD